MEMLFFIPFFIQALFGSVTISKGFKHNLFLWFLAAFFSGSIYTQLDKQQQFPRSTSSQPIIRTTFYTTTAPLNNNPFYNERKRSSLHSVLGQYNNNNAWPRWWSKDEPITTSPS
ncbi:hypothetical protein BX666DRAFT_1945209 [Dichotomocladium elegans]|nr:hypothetical protein BX666DRAFT_1945209 [Dichotomocladium elegans]